MFYIAYLKYIAVSALFIIGLYTSACAQDPGYIFKHLTTADGLINNRVTDLFLDRKGYLWIGTQAGLQRYDGTRFKNYVADIRDTAALYSDRISVVFEDSKERLWVGADHGGPYILNRRTSAFYSYNLHTTKEAQIFAVKQITEDKQGNIWLGGQDGYYKLNDKTNRFELYSATLGIAKNVLTGGITVDDDNNLWLATAEGVKLYNQHERKLYDHADNPGNNPLLNIKKAVSGVYKNGNELWVSFSREVYHYNLATKELKEFAFYKSDLKSLAPELQKERIGGITILTDGMVVVSLPEKGFAVFNKEKNEFYTTAIDNSKSFTFHSNPNDAEKIRVIQDREKNILVSTPMGINIFNPERKFFTEHKRVVEKGALFPLVPVSDFLQLPDGTVYISYYNAGGGIVKTDSELHFKKHYLYKENGKEQSLENQAWQIFKDDKNSIWAPNQMNTVLKLDLNNEHIHIDKDPLLRGPVNAIRQDGKDIWIAHWYKGLVKINMEEHSRKEFSRFLYADPKSLTRAHSLLPDKDQIWVGTFLNGIQLFDKKQEKFVEGYIADIHNNKAISNNCVLDIIRYSKDTLVLATEMGINIFDTRAKTFTAITTKQGLPNNIVLSVMKDDEGNIWAACGSGGFCKLNMHNMSVISYGINEGITDDVFNSRFFRLQNNTYLIGTSSGFLSFDPATFKPAPLSSNVQITGIQVLKKEICIDSLPALNKPLILSYKQNTIRISFSSFDYLESGSVKFFYKMEGVDHDWVEADKSNEAVYHQLNNGDYIFTVKCANKDGIFCDEVTQFKIIIKPPFFKTWWFITLCAVSFLFVITLLVKRRERNIKSAEAEKLKMQRLNAEQYKSKLELEQIINYFSSSLVDKNSVDDVLWDVAKNLIGHLGFVDCMIYLWNEDKTKMVQKAGFGPKDSEEQIRIQPFDVLPGQGVVGYVIATKSAVVIDDTSVDPRYRPDDMVRLSEITVPLLYNNELIGVIDSEHHEKEFFTQQHLQILTTIATLMSNKIKSIETEETLHRKNIEMYSMDEQLSKARLEALRSQMNPHFIFNSLNAIQECILTNKVDAAYKYLSKFSKLQRMVLNNSEKELIPLSSEIEMLELYLTLESLRFSKSFTYEIDKDSVIDEDEIMIPSMITQPFAENAIWHGLRNKEGEKKLYIGYKEQDGFILITIHDNGIGRAEAGKIKNQKLGNTQFASKATILMQQRLNILSLQFNASIKQEVIDDKDEDGNSTGTTIIISFPANL